MPPGFLCKLKGVYMARFCPLFSGSSGNSTYISAGGRGLLIDAGASCKALTAAVSAAGGSMEALSAIAITHEHTDHIKGLKVLLKKCRVPLIASSKTLEALTNSGIIPPEAELIAADGGGIEAGGFEINYFPTSHDCPGSGGYSVTLPDGRRVAVCTDLGIVTDTVRSRLNGCIAVLIESNHDVTMLKNGPYPPQLKLRILSESGHLSNAACAAELPELVKNGTTRLILGHLSRHNNLPMLALSCAKATLLDAAIAPGSDCLLTVASPAENQVLAL